jgi:hypothetical protein
VQPALQTGSYCKWYNNTWSHLPADSSGLCVPQVTNKSGEAATTWCPEHQGSYFTQQQQQQQQQQQLCQ